MKTPIFYQGWSEGPINYAKVICHKNWITETHARSYEMNTQKWELVSHILLRTLQIMFIHTRKDNNCYTIERRALKLKGVMTLSAFQMFLIKMFS